MQACPVSQKNNVIASFHLCSARGWSSCRSGPVSGMVSMAQPSCQRLQAWLAACRRGFQRRNISLNLLGSLLKHLQGVLGKQLIQNAPLNNCIRQRLLCCLHVANFARVVSFGTSAPKPALHLISNMYSSIINFQASGNMLSHKA